MEGPIEWNFIFILIELQEAVTKTWYLLKNFTDRYAYLAVNEE